MMYNADLFDLELSFATALISFLRFLVSDPSSPFEGDQFSQYIP